MKYDSLIYLTEQLKLLRGIDETNTSKVDSYINYIRSIIGDFYIKPSSINRDLKKDDYDISFNAKLSSNDYVIVTGKSFYPYYVIDTSSIGEYRIKTTRIEKGQDGLVLFINTGDRFEKLGFYIVEKNNDNQELHISFYDNNTLSELIHSYNINFNVLKTYSSKKIYELGILPDEEATTTIFDLGLLNENDLQSNSIGNVDDLITYRIINTLSFNGLINRINNALSKHKHI